MSSIPGSRMYPGQKFGGLKPRTNEEIAEVLKSKGYPVDEAGRVILRNAGAGILLAFDPSKKEPMDGVSRCMQRIEACVFEHHDEAHPEKSAANFDLCAAANPRCVNTTPWLGDPNGLDCCPEACLTQYFQDRATMNPPNALSRFLDTACYPGLSALLNNGSQP